MSNHTFEFEEEDLISFINDMFTIQVKACIRAGKLESLKPLGKKNYGYAMQDSKLDAKATLKLLTRDL